MSKFWKINSRNKKFFDNKKNLNYNEIIKQINIDKYSDKQKN